MTDFHKLKVKNLHKETSDCVVIELDVPEKLEKEFKFTQGQYLTFETIINEEKVRRSYSLCTSPNEKKWKVAVKKIQDGKFSTFVNDELKVGDELEVMKPTGNFSVEIDSTKKKNYIAFAAGSGITPMLSIIKTHLESEPNSTFKLFYVNRKVSSIIFRDEIENLKNKFLSRLQIFHFLTKENRGFSLFNGRFSIDKLNELTDKVIPVNQINDCFICGPKEMIFLIKEQLEKSGLSSDKIHFELFHSGNSDDQKEKVAKILKKQSNHTEVTIIDGQKEIHFEMDNEYDNILDAALANDADLPFACKGGVCCTCRGKIVEGTVEMKLNYGLEPEEVEQGYVLTCQSVPTSSKVIVDFDA